MGKHRPYRAIVSSDWNECLAPSGPFDVISFLYPELEPQVKEVFRAYTGNRIALSEAMRRISGLLPYPITRSQMDGYLDACFETYRGVPELIEWCNQNDVLFMINTTGMQGYFERVFKRGLLPQVPVVSAHPIPRYRGEEGTTCRWYDLLEVEDKPKNTRAVMEGLGIGPDRVLLIGDSGGDGPHFEWGAKAGATLIGSMTKWSLQSYCDGKGIRIHRYLGPRYAKGEERAAEKERGVHFMDLVPQIEGIL